MIISISGPSFSGKTYLISKIINDSDINFKIIGFEAFFNKNKSIKSSYFNFINNIHLSSQDNNLICESIYPLEDNPFINYDNKDILNIKCLLPRSMHYLNINTYIEKYGNLSATRRGSSSVSQIREKYLKYFKKVNGIHYNGNNYEEVLKGIKNVFFDRENNNY